MINKESLTHHISQQFNAELEEVRSHLLAMGGLVEKQVNDAVTALIEADSGLAQQVREVDEQINQMGATSTRNACASSPVASRRPLTCA